MSIKLSRDGRLHQLYRYTYDSYPTSSFCPFFWKVLIAAALLPVTWVSYPFRATNVIWRALYSLIIWAIFITTAFVVSQGIAEPKVFWVVAIVIGVLVGFVIAVGLAALACAGIEEAALRTKDFIQTNEVIAVVRTRKESVMDRYCPKIDWN